MKKWTTIFLIITLIVILLLVENRNSRSKKVSIIQYNQNSISINDEDLYEELNNIETYKNNNEKFILDYYNKERLLELNNDIRGWYFNREEKNQRSTFPDVAYIFTEKYKTIVLGEDKKNIFLTFDCGYEAGYTNDILDILQENNVKTIFFLTGSYINRNPELVKRMAKEGHLIGNHTLSHPKLPAISNEKILREIQIVENKFIQLTGEKIDPFLRPPYGSYSERTLAIVNALGYRTVFWSMAFRDWDRSNQPGKEYVYNHVTDYIHNGAVILMHSVSESNTLALDKVIKELVSQGYHFKTLYEFN